MKVFFAALFSLFLSNANAQVNARVSKVNGIEVYILSEPVRKYEVVMGQGNSIQWSSLVSGGLVNDNIATKVSRFVRGVQNQATQQNITFDAIIYSNGKSVSAVKFTDNKTEENDRIAEVQKINGMPVYIMSEPLKKYSVESDKGGGVKWKSLVTAGLVNNSIEEDLQKYLNKLEKDFKRGKIDALLYTRGKTCDGIKFL
ncbi:MAG: hypothetical protein KF829_04445 [Ferruginibacter sp.]|nr:hypothetical protein [Ferruginibacter sp.]